jgi:hypothetical protein
MRLAFWRRGLDGVDGWAAGARYAVLPVRAPELSTAQRTPSISGA